MTYFLHGGLNNQRFFIHSFFPVLILLFLAIPISILIEGQQSRGSILLAPPD